MDTACGLCLYPLHHLSKMSTPPKNQHWPISLLTGTISLPKWQHASDPVVWTLTGLVPTLASGPIQKLSRKADRHPLLSTIERALPGHLGGIGEARLKTTTSLVYYRKDKKKNYYKTKNELQSQLNCRHHCNIPLKRMPALPCLM